MFTNLNSRKMASCSGGHYVPNIDNVNMTADWILMGSNLLWTATPVKKSCCRLTAQIWFMFMVSNIEKHIWTCVSQNWKLIELNCRRLQTITRAFKWPKVQVHTHQESRTRTGDEVTSQDVWQWIKHEYICYWTICHPCWQDGQSITSTDFLQQYAVT